MKQGKQSLVLATLMLIALAVANAQIGQAVAGQAGSPSPLPGTAMKAEPNDGIQYVSANGNDSSDGLSWGAAKSTISKAALALTLKGGEIIVGASVITWTGGRVPSNVKIVFTGANQKVKFTTPIILSRGDELVCANGITLQSVSATLGGTVFQASGLSSEQDGIDIKNASGVTIQGCTVDMNNLGRYGIYLSNSSNDTLKRIVVNDPVSDGVRLDSGTSRGEHSYDDVLEQVMVIHSASGDGFDFLTNAGGQDMDRISCIDCKYHSVDPGSRAESGLNAMAMTTGTVVNNNIANFTCIGCHLGGAAGEGSGLAITQSGNANVVNVFFTGLIEHNFTPRRHGTAINVSTTGPSGIRGFYFRGGLAHWRQSYNVTPENASMYSITNLDSPSVGKSAQFFTTDGIRFVANSATPKATNGIYFYNRSGGPVIVNQTTDGIIHLYRPDLAKDELWLDPQNSRIMPAKDDTWSIGSPTVKSFAVVSTYHLDQGNAKQWAGTVKLSAGSGAFTFPKRYSVPPVCTATDTTHVDPVRVSTTTTALKVNGTGSDVIGFICVGNPQ